jgi:DNA-binding response OmpR family regulator
MKRTPSPSILLVDDAVDERQMYADFFQTIGFRTLQAATALDAYRLAVELVPDAAVIDLILPGMNGLELVRKLKGNEETVRVPVIALTGHSHPFDRQVALAAGCDRFLVKPCSPNDLLAEVRGLLARSKPGVERGHRRASVPRDGLLAG